MTTDELGTCAYVAAADDPSNWHGEGPDDWTLDEETWSCPHDALEHEDDDYEYCVFHMAPDDVPADVDEAERFVQVVNDESVSDDGKIARRKKEFVGATFGEFEIESGTTLDAGDEFPVRFDHGVFREGIRGDNIRVRHGTEFNGALFTGVVSFFDARFTGDGQVLFKGTEFDTEKVTFFGVDFIGDGDVSFKHATFTVSDELSFGGAKFTGNGDVSFRGAQFTGDGDISFSGVEFIGGDGNLWFSGADFSDTTFTGRGNVSFSSAEFTGGEGNIWSSGAEFSGATLTGDVSFDRVVFAGAKFRDASFGRADSVSFEETEFSRKVDLEVESFPETTSFADAQFAHCDLEVSAMNDMNLSRANFTDVDLRHVDFNRSNLEESLFSRANLYNTSFIGAKLDGAVFGNARINQNTDFGEERNYCVPYDPTSNHDSESKLDSIDRMIRRYLPLRPAWGDTSRDRSKSECDQSPSDHANGTREDELLSAARAYYTLERIGRENSLPKLQRIGFVRRQEMHRLRYAEEAATAESGAWHYWLKWLRASVARLALLYGESPWRVIAVSLGAIVFAGMLYPLGGFRAGDASDAEVIRATSVGEWLSLLPDGIYFSTLTFTTLGFGDFQPAGWGRFLATGETALGATMIALLVFVLGRRAAR